MHWRIAALALAVASCKDKPRGTAFGAAATGSGSSTTSEIVGSLWVDGKAVTTTACRPGRGFGTYVEVVTDAGKLRFEDKSLYWSPNPKDPLRGDRLDCEKLDRSWGGGSRADGTSYWRGTLAFACTAKKFAVSGELALDCGNITPEERAGLDAQRRDMRAAQAQQGSAPPPPPTGSAPPPPPTGSATKPDCDRMERHLLNLVYEAASTRPLDEVEADTEHFSPVKMAEWTKGCTTWPATDVACVLAAKTVPTALACRPTLPSKRRCEQLLAHIVDLEFANAATGGPTADIAKQKAAVIAAKREAFLASCLKTQLGRVECALVARDKAALAACDAP